METVDVGPRVEKRTLHLYLQRLEQKDVSITAMTAVMAIEIGHVVVESSLRVRHAA